MVAILIPLLIALLAMLGGMGFFGNTKREYDPNQRGGSRFLDWML